MKRLCSIICNHCPAFFKVWIYQVILSNVEESEKIAHIFCGKMRIYKLLVFHHFFFTTIIQISHQPPSLTSITLDQAGHSLEYGGEWYPIKIKSNIFALHVYFSRMIGNWKGILFSCVAWEGWFMGCDHYRVTWNASIGCRQAMEFCVNWRSPFS